MMRTTSNEYRNKDDEEDLNLAVALVDKEDDPESAVVSSISVSEEDGLTWTDHYFADRSDVVAVFDFSRDDYARRNEQVKSIINCIHFLLTVSIIAAMNVVPETQPFLIWLFFLVQILPVFLVRHTVWIPHLAVTTTGVRYVEPPEKESRFRGSTILIPLEEIEAVEIAEGGGAVGIRTPALEGTDYVVHGCPRGLRKIRRYKALSEWKEDIARDGQDWNCMRLDISNLLEPYRFKKLVMSLKQQQEANLPVHKEEVASTGGGITLI